MLQRIRRQQVGCCPLVRQGQNGRLQLPKTLAWRQPVGGCHDQLARYGPSRLWRSNPDTRSESRSTLAGGPETRPWLTQMTCSSPSLIIPANALPPTFPSWVALPPPAVATLVFPVESRAACHLSPLPPAVGRSVGLAPPGRAAVARSDWPGQDPGQRHY